jgi:hypothetical protein
LGLSQFLGFARQGGFGLAVHRLFLHGGNDTHGKCCSYWRLWAKPCGKLYHIAAALRNICAISLSAAEVIRLPFWSILGRREVSVLKHILTQSPLNLIIAPGRTGER